MKKNSRLMMSVFWIVLGLVLCVCYFCGWIEAFWSSMGFAFIGVGILQVIRQIRYHRDQEYQEKIDIEEQDERNKFIANKAWAWAGYLFVITAGVGTIVFKLLGREDLMMMSSCSVCLIMVFYWISYMFLKKKY